MLPATAQSDIASSSSGVLSGLAPIATLVGGIFLGMVIIEYLVDMAHRRKHPTASHQDISDHHAI